MYYYFPLASSWLFTALAMGLAERFLEVLPLEESQQSLFLQISHNASCQAEAVLQGAHEGKPSIPPSSVPKLSPSLGDREVIRLLWARVSSKLPSTWAGSALPSPGLITLLILEVIHTH